jgi:oxygen-independent coproporphyrinogen-3 oxidase
LPDEDVSADMYLVTQDILGAAGLPAYEVSNHAGAGAESRHNLIYWRSGDYAGIGPGAHGRLTLGGRRWATDTPKAPLAWLAQVEATGRGERPREEVPGRERAAEYLMMGMRLAEGIDLARFAALNGGQGLSRVTIGDLAGLGLLMETDRGIAATPKGRAVLNGVLRELWPE